MSDENLHIESYISTNNELGNRLSLTFHGRYGVESPQGNQCTLRDVLIRNIRQCFPATTGPLMVNWTIRAGDRELDINPAWLRYSFVEVVNTVRRYSGAELIIFKAFAIRRHRNRNSILLN